MRNLASIQKVLDVQPINGADKIVCISVLGWKLIAKVDEFKIGDLCVYIEIDSLLPKDNPVFSFMERYKYRVKSIKMRGQISQGLALPLSMFPDIGKPKEGMDLTDVLKIEKYEKEEEQDPVPPKNVWYKPLMKYSMFRKVILPLISKKASGGFPSHIISKSDETRIQSMPWMFETYKDAIFVATEKCEGCLSEETIISTPSGPMKIKDICENKKRIDVYSLNLDNFQIEQQKVTKFSIQENNNDWYEIITESGKKLILTGEHRIFLPELMCWRRVDEISENDIVILEN